MLSIVLSAFVLGLLGSLHCIGMCGPLVLGLPFQHIKPEQTFLSILLYHLGKAITYSIFGLLAGTIGQGFVLFEWQQTLSIVAGSTLLLITFFPFLKSKMKMSNWFEQIFNKVYQSTNKQGHLSSFITFGFLNGFLPCGLVYTAIAAATVSANSIHGAAFMFFFGIGTIPSLTFVILLHKRISPPFRKYLNRSSYYLSIIIGVLLLLRGLNLGIPYISPELKQDANSIECCHRS